MRWQRIARVATDFVSLLLLVGAIPAGLVLVATHQPQGRAPWAQSATTALLALAGVAWALVIFHLLRGVWAHLHHRGRFDSAIHRFAGRLAMTLSLTFTVAAPVSAATSPTAVVASTSHLASTPPPPPPGQSDTVYVVKTGDCLWTIAEQFYGDGRRYVAILNANFGKIIGRGERFDNPRIIRTGWKLTIPNLSTPMLSPTPTTEEIVPNSTQVAPPPTMSITATTSTPPRALATSTAAVGGVTSDDDLLQTIGALSLGLLAGAVATRRRRSLVDDAHEEPTPDATVDAVVRLGEVILRGGLVEQVIAELDAKGHLRPAQSTTTSSTNQQNSEGRVALPLGQREGRTEVALISRGQTVSIRGSKRQSLVALQQLVASTWGDDLGAVATSSSMTASDHVALGDPRTVLYFGDADDLEPHVARQVVVVTEQLGGDLDVTVDERATHVGDGVVLKSIGLDPQLHEGLSRAINGICEGDHGELEGVTAPMVRLLTPTPRIDGLAQPIEPKRLRRGIELAAYLSVHRDHLVTGGQLRTELLGEGDSDGSSKSLSNTVSALRRSLGKSESGDLHLPPATRAGCYQLQPSVSSDYEEALVLLHAASVAEGDRALALVRAACALIDGKPLVSCVLGYDWFFREGHDRVLSRALTSGVAKVTDHAIARGHLALARHLVDQAALVNPYSETLARAAMSIAAATDDVDQLQHEWNSHLRRLEELEPGLAPSATTEAHFWRLHGLCGGRLPA